jgi:hypothetical protein
MAKNHAVTDRSVPATKRVELATAAAWQIWTLCDELLVCAARIDGRRAPPPHHSALVIKLLVSRARDLAQAAALCLEEDEANEPFADLEETVTHRTNAWGFNGGKQRGFGDSGCADRARVAAGYALQLPP